MNLNFPQVFTQQTPSARAQCELTHLPFHTIKCLPGEGFVLPHHVESPGLLAACCKVPEGESSLD